MTKPFYRWTSKELIEFAQRFDRESLIKISAYVIGGLIFFIFIFWPAWIARPQVKGQITLLRSQIQSAQGQMMRENALLEEKKKYEELIKNVNSRLLHKRDAEGLLGILANLAKENRVNLLSSHPQDEAAEFPPPFKEKYRVASYGMSLEGGYHALASFVSEIENYPAILRVDNFGILPQDEKPESHIAQIQVSGFVLPKEGEKP